MAHIHIGATPIEAVTPHIRKISRADVHWALLEGWRDFRDRRGDLLLLPAIYSLAGFLAFALALDASLVPMLFPAVAGLSILGPAVAAGFYELARRREAGLDASWAHFLDPLRGRARNELILLTLGLVVLFALWMVAAYLIFLATLAGSGAVTLSQFLTQLFTTREGWTMIVVGNLVGFAFAVATLCLTWVSFPMVVDRPVSAASAVMTSLRAVRENPEAAVIWGVHVAVLLAVGCATFFLGLMIVVPVLGYATWHLYTRIVDR
jgi:uncharacterized membrane protein